MNIANSIKCVDPNHNLTYVLDFVDRTHLGCIYEKIVIGCTTQFKIDKSGRNILQTKYLALCGNLNITPCDFTYNLSGS